MYDTGKVVVGLVIFVVVVTFPFWYGLTSGEPRGRPELPVPEGACVESTEYMKAYHMDLLDSWRDAVVRQGKRVYVSSSNERFTMSLTGTCLERCHAKAVSAGMSTMDGFCRRCHEYAGVRPYCWGCHNDCPGELK